MCRDWKEFVELPVFLSQCLVSQLARACTHAITPAGSLAISLVYLTTLSFDGIMLCESYSSMKSTSG